jgi:hypothetical protein
VEISNGKILSNCLLNSGPRSARERVLESVLDFSAIGEYFIDHIQAQIPIKGQ